MLEKLLKISKYLSLLLSGFAILFIAAGFWKFLNGEDSFVFFFLAFCFFIIAGGRKILDR